MNEQPPQQPVTNPMPEQPQPMEGGQHTATPVEQQYVGVWYRLLARILDYMFLGVISSPFLITIFVIVFKAGLDSGRSGQVSSAVQLTSSQSLLIGACSLAVLLIGAFYQIFMNASKMQGTFGKRILGFKIIDLEGKRLTLNGSLKRYLFSEGLGIPNSLLSNSTNSGAIIVSTTFGLIYFLYFVVDASIGGSDAKKQTLHDRLAHTYVVYR